MPSETTLKELVEFYPVVRRVVGRDTSSDPDRWDLINILWGQCAVVALLVQDVFGGRLVNAKAQPGGISHYWNELPSGHHVDLTRDQFQPFHPVFTDLTYEKQRDYVLSFPATKERYEILRKRFDAYVEEIAGQVAKELGEKLAQYVSGKTS